MDIVNIVYQNATITYLNLSKTKRLYSMNDQGNYAFEKQGVEPEDLPNLMGKEAAEKMMASPSHHLSNQDLQIGGEGMKAFYDKKVPNILNSIGKKYGVKTQLYGQIGRAHV